MHNFFCALVILDHFAMYDADNENIKIYLVLSTLLTLHIEKHQTIFYIVQFKITVKSSKSGYV